MLMRREALQQIGIFDESLCAAEAVEWLIRMRDRNIEALRIDYISADRRLHRTNTSRLKRIEGRQEYATILRQRLKKHLVFKANI